MKDAVIGVEATHYLRKMMAESPAHEPLLAALGGEPIALKHYLNQELDNWKDNAMRPLFVFDGQSIVNRDDMALRNAKNALNETRQAWELYADSKPTDAVRSFGTSGII